MQQITNLSISILKVHPQNREFFDDIEGEQYEKFKRSIQEDGIITPLIVSPDMTIISGHQRFKACKDLGIELIPVIINESLTNEEDKLKKLLAANFGRLKNNPIKQGKVYSEYVKLCGVRQGSAGKVSLEGQNAPPTQEQIAKELGVGIDTLKRLKKLQTLSPELQQLIEDGSVKYTTALNVYAKLSSSEQSQLIEELGKEKIAEMTQKQTEQYLQEKKALQMRNETLSKKLDRRCNKEEKEVEKVTKEFNTKIEDMESEKLKLQSKLFLFQEQTKTIEYKDNPDSLIEIESLRKQIKEKEDYAKKYRDTLKELNEKNQLVSKFMGESTNFELISTTSETTLKMMDFVKEMSKYDYLSEAFNDIPDATRKEWVRSIYGVYKWSKNILNTVKHDDVIGINKNIIDVKSEYVDIEENTREEY